MRSPCSPSILVLAGLAGACHESSSRSAQDPSFLAPGVNDLGMVAGSFAIENGILAAHAFELGDVHLRILDLRDGRQTILSDVRAQGGPVLHGGFASFLVSEPEAGDRNGDGDAADVVLHVFDTRTGTTVSLGLACDLQHVQSGALVAFSVPEAEQGEDLDGDGELRSHLAFVHEADLGRTTPLDLAVVAGETLVSGRRIVLQADETVAGDLDGDGDELDRVAFVYDADTGVLHDTGLAVSATRLEGSLLALLVDEEENGHRDLNSNGRTDDVVGVFYDLDLSTSALRMTGAETCSLGPASAELVLLGQGPAPAGVWVFDRPSVSLLPVDGLEGPVLGEPRSLHGRGLTFLVDESRLGADVNHDGDRMDAALHTFDGRTGATTLTGRIAVTEPQTDGRRVVFLGPANRDQAPPPAPTTIFELDLRTGAVRDLRILADEFFLQDERIVAAVVEAWVGRDLNGDQLLGRVLAVHDLRTGRTTTTGIRVDHTSITREAVQLDGDVLVLFNESSRLTAFRLR